MYNSTSSGYISVRHQ